MKKVLNIAFLSPNRETYSETFVKAQKELLPHKIFHYYNGIVPTILENGNLMYPTFFQTFQSKLKLFKGNWILNNLKKSFKEKNIDVVLAQFGPTGAAVAEVCKELEIPLIVHFHGADAYVYNYLNPIDNYAILFKFCKVIIVVSEDMKRQLINLGAPKEKIFLTCYGPRNEFFQITNELLGKKILSIGRFVDKKAPYLTILAFSKVVKNFPFIKLIMVGDGPLLNTCINISKYLNIESNIEFKGALSHSEIISLMGQAFCFVQHSITAENGDKEGSPVAIIEASAAGLPVVSTMHAGIPFIVKHGSTGFLVKEGDVDGMSFYLQQLCQDLNLAKEMGYNGRIHIQSNASIEKYINDINDFIFKAIESK